MDDDFLGNNFRKRSVSSRRNNADLSPSRRIFPPNHMLRIDNFTSQGSTPYTPLDLSPRIPVRREPKGFIAELSNMKETNFSLPFPIDDEPFSRNSVPPFVSVEVLGVEVPALLHSASPISLLSTFLVNKLGLVNDITPSTLAPSSVFTSENGSWRVEGGLKYFEFTLKGIKQVTQVYVGRDLPADLVLGVDFLKKTQMRLNFAESAAIFPASGRDIRISFMPGKEIRSYNKRKATSNRLVINSVDSER